jgi:phytoene dehydrogenase-like protein
MTSRPRLYPTTTGVSLGDLGPSLVPLARNIAATRLPVLRAPEPVFVLPRHRILNVMPVGEDHLRITAQGADVRMSDGVRSLRRDGDGWVAQTRRGEVRARAVVANLLPQNVRAMLEGVDAPRLDALSARVAEGWGAAMLYLGLSREAPLRDEAHHLELVGDAAEPFVEGNHVFVSVSARDETDRGPHGARTATVSTHVPMRKLLAMDADAQGRYVRWVQERMEATIARRAPEVTAAVVHRMTASPRTFERFTGRFRGYVGGVPRRAGLHHYEGMWPSPVAPGFYLVGDSVFPGQSTLATAVGGMRVAERVLRG